MPKGKYAICKLKHAEISWNLVLIWYISTGPFIREEILCREIQGEFIFVPGTSVCSMIV